MAIPWLAAQAGIISAIAMMALAYIVTLVLHLMLAEIALRTKGASETLTMFKQHLFKGSKVMVALFYLVMLVILCTNLAAYVAGSADIIVSLVGIPWQFAALLFFLIAALVVLFGLRSVAANEAVAVPAMLAIVLGLAVLSALAPVQYPLPHPPPALESALAVYGMIMFAFSSLYSVPQAAAGLKNPRTSLKRVVAAGLGINLLVTLLITLCTLACSSEVTEVAIIGWSSALGPTVHVLSSILIIFAMLSCYWSISLQLADITQVFTKLPHLLSWIIATLPSLLLALFLDVGFLDFMSIAGGCVAVVVALLVIPAYFNATHSVTDTSELVLGKLGKSKLLAATIFFCYIMMAVGSLL